MTKSQKKIKFKNLMKFYTTPKTQRMIKDQRNYSERKKIKNSTKTKIKKKKINQINSHLMHMKKKIIFQSQEKIIMMTIILIKDQKKKKKIIKL